jgi:hypothetical protein
MAAAMAEAPIFEALAAEVQGTTMGLPVYRYPNVRYLRSRLRFQERQTSGLVSQPRPRLSDALSVQGHLGAMYDMDEHHPDL